jgi:hypothetical protein
MSAIGGGTDMRFLPDHFRFWHLSDMPRCPLDVCFRGKSEVPFQGRQGSF